MAKFTHVGQVVLTGTPIETTEEAVNIGGDRYKLPDGKERIYAGKPIEVVLRPSSVGGLPVTGTDPNAGLKITGDIDYAGGRFSVFDEVANKPATPERAPKVKVKYSYRPENILANIFQYDVKKERTSRDIQTIDMRYPVEDLGTTKMSGSFSAYIQYSNDTDVIQKAYDNGEHLQLEFFMGTQKGVTVNAVFHNIEFSHTADGKVIIKVDFSGNKI